ncbi:MAG: peptide chain release factor N(5)-glutamine methyltransferase [Anaerovoracaceae bacterium]|jgi:release factor glutamine methyltransferase
MSLLVSDIVKMGDLQLREAGVAEHKIEAEILYCWLKKIDRARFFMAWSDEADDKTMEQYLQLIAKRCQHIPLQHLTGEQEFMGMTFDVRPDVLIPRQDTETVVETAEKLFQGRKGDILDLCCGSGCIGVALAHHIPKAKVTAVDSSEAAVELTKDNANAWGIKMDVRLGNLFEPVKRKKYNMIVSNPPYIRSDVIPTLMPEVRDHEPIEALDGGADGLDYYLQIIGLAPKHLKKEGILVLEIGNDQSAAVEQLMIETGKLCDIQTYKDLAGNDRVVSARLLGKSR